MFDLTATANTDMFISKLDVSGNFVWAKRIGGPVNDVAYGALATDAAGNVFMATVIQYYNTTTCTQHILMETIITV